MTELLERLVADVGGRYVVERELGRGGMATVYLARDLVDERQVAIKVMDPELAAAVGADRFKREIAVASSLNHPHILGIINSGEAAGTSYYVMPFVKGETLRDRLDREKQLPMEDAIRIAREVADALDYAHQNGIVHRDVKPENILLDDGRVLVADFGIARAASSADNKTLTKTGVALGTPHYMSPEQIMAEKDIDGRTDQYALACMLHEMLAGQPPFVGPHTQSLMAQHVLDDPPFVSRFRPGTPGNVEDAILTGLAKNKVDRFPTAGDFGSALENSGYTSLMKVTRLQKTATQAQLQALVAQKPVPLWKKVLPLAIAVVLGVGATFGVYKAVVEPKAPPAISDAEKARERRLAVLYLRAADPALAPVADGLTEALIARLRGSAGLEVRSQEAVLRFRSEEIPADSAGRLLDVARVVAGTVREEAGKLRVEVRLVDAASGVSQGDFALPPIERASVFAVRDSLASRVAELLRKQVGQEVRLAEQKKTTSSPEAWTMLQRADRARNDADDAFAAGDSARFLALLDSADALAARSAALDPAWAEPVVLQAQTRLRRGKALQDRNPAAAGAMFDSALAVAERALAIDTLSVDALEARGEARFVRTRLGLITDSRLVKQMIDTAEVDLLKAVKLEPTQASALVVLSRLQYARPNVAAGFNFARQAYEADAYLRNASDILFRLFAGAYDQKAFPDARSYCDEGHRRFPASKQFTLCRLYLFVAPADSTPVAEVWKVVADHERVAAPQERPFARREAEMLAAAALGKLGLKDSARAVIARARGDASVDPRGELTALEAVVRVRLGDNEEAIALLERYLTAHPEHRRGFSGANFWWWEPLASDPRFMRITALSR